MQASPIAATVGGVPAVIGGGKMGDVYAMNSVTGALLWKTPVGVHDGTDNDSALLLAHKLTIKVPYTYEPGSLGGILTNMAVADGSVYVATIDVPLIDQDPERRPTATLPRKAPRRRGDRGAERGHRQGRVGHEGASLPCGAATVSNDLVFTTLVNGELLALNRSTGAIVYQRKLPTTTNSADRHRRQRGPRPRGRPGDGGQGRAAARSWSPTPCPDRRALSRRGSRVRRPPGPRTVTGGLALEGDRVEVVHDREGVVGFAGKVQRHRGEAMGAEEVHGVDVLRLRWAG